MNNMRIPERSRDTDGLKTVVFTLRPRPSVDLRAVYILWMVLTLAWFTIASIFSITDGRSIFHYFGAEYILIAFLAFTFGKRTNVLEQVQITHDKVHVYRRDVTGTLHKAFPTYWTQVKVSGAQTLNCNIEIGSHGEAVRIGRYLTTSQKVQTVEKIKSVLKEAQTAGFD
ncbi:MAG: DUF2244 domain-containing protein [Magnetovibrio sp.]|nr:DUF2244 domain-containing protein [Magnetovibrio sp.]